MEDCELELLLADIESDRSERKASLSERDKIREAICQFANDLPNHRLPGVLFIGANDDGSCAGLHVTEQLLLTLADMRSDGNILPFPTITVQKRTLRGGEMAVVVVQPSDDPPVRFRGRVCVRVGPRRAYATAEEERRLTEKRRARDLPYDVRPIPAANLDDLDLDLFRRTYLPSSVSDEILAQNDRSIEQQLASVRFSTLDLPPKPTTLGILVIGKDPRQLLPGAYVQFLRLEGKDLTDPIKDQKVIDGPLPDLLRMLDEVFESHISVSLDMTLSPAIQRPDYPIVALQQLAGNAVLHRTYEGTHAPVRISWFSDRVEILSPGGPFGQVNPENFGKPGVTDYRNPHLAEALRNLGYVQRFGVGIQLARRELDKNGNPQPEFVVTETHVLATLRSRP